MSQLLTRIVPVLALLLTFTLLAFSTLSAHAADSSDVVVLTDANFEELTSSGSWLLEFYAPWCGHCKTLAPTYEDAARRLRGTMQLAKIDATVHTTLGSKFDIKGFPTLKFLREGEARNYNGPRTVEGIVAFGKEMNAPAVTTITKVAEYEAITEKHPVAFVFFGGKGGVERRLFDSLAYRLQGTVKFFAIEQKNAEDINTRAGVTADDTPIVLLLTKNADTSDPVNRYSGPWVDVELRTYLLRNKLPLISTLDSSNFDDITTSGKKIVYAILNTNDPKGSEAYLKKLYPIASIPSIRDNFIFASIDGIKYHKYVTQFGIHVGDGGHGAKQYLPTYVVVDKDIDYYYELPTLASDEPSYTNDPSRLESFLQDIIAGSISLTCTTPWYNPGRYIKLIEKSMAKMPVWQVAIVSVVVMLSILGSMFFCCFYGMDATDDEVVRQAELTAARDARAHGGKKEKKDASAASSADSTTASSKDNKEEGLRSRRKDQ